MKRNYEENAFTLMELLIAITVMSILIISCSLLFVAVSRSVRDGIGRSKILINTLSFSDYLYDDSRFMAPPGSGGTIIIKNEEIEDVAESPTGDDVMTYRSDQLWFIKFKTESDIPIAPAMNNSFGPVDVDADFVRVWYGHVNKIYPEFDGSEATHVLAIEDDFAANWVLGRHQLFFDPDFTGQRSSATSRAGDIYQGLFDVTKERVVGAGGLFGTDLTTNSLGGASDYVFSPGLRMRARRLPFKEDEAAEEADFTVNRLAQMHPYFVSGVGHMEIQVAGDYSPRDGFIDVARATSANSYKGGAILWYDAYARDYPTADPTVDEALQVFPAQEVNIDSDADPNQVSPITYQPFDAVGGIFHFQQNDLGIQSAWPYMIRVRYWIYGPTDPASGDSDMVKMPMEHIIKVNRGL